jgi:hypothetical protein
MWRLRRDSGWHIFDRTVPVIDGSRPIHTALGIGGQIGRVAVSVRREAMRGIGQERRLSSTKVVLFEKQWSSRAF